MDVLRHLVVVDHSKKALVFAIRGTFSISGIISDWVSFCGTYKVSSALSGVVVVDFDAITDMSLSYTAPFCGGVGHVAMSEVASKMWDLTKDRVLAKLKTLPSDYEVVITGHSLGTYSCWSVDTHTCVSMMHKLLEMYLTLYYITRCRSCKPPYDPIVPQKVYSQSQDTMFCLCPTADFSPTRSCPRSRCCYYSLYSRR